MHELSFDQHQFAGRRARAVTKETGIAFSDYGRMHTDRRSAQSFSRVPAFALDENKLAQVLKQVAWQYAHVSGPCPEEVSLEQLKIDADKRHKAYLAARRLAHLSDYQRNLIEAHARSIEKAGGYLQMYASVAWQAWRRRMSSVDIACETGMSPGAVRQLLSRMNKIGRNLFPELALPVSTRACRTVAANRCKRGDPIPSRFLIEEVVALLQAGKTQQEVATELGCSYGMVVERRQAWEKRNGVKIPLSRAHSGSVTQEATAALLKIGLSLSETARLLGSDIGTVRKRRRRWQEETGDTLPSCPSGKRVRTTRNQKRRAKRILKLLKGLCGIEGCQNPVQAPDKKECLTHAKYYAQKQGELKARNKAALQSSGEQHADHENSSETLRPLAEAGGAQEEQRYSAELQLA